MSSSLFGARCRRFPLFAVWIALGVVAFARAETPSPSPDAFARLSQPGHVLLMRHAYAPGVGDPTGMVLNDCSTQRNLDERGRAQARKLGERLRAAGVSGVRVYTSQWCRCREAADLLAVGTVEDLPALNSFFEQPEMRDERLAALRAFLDKLPRNGRPVVLVTHQVTVTGLTNYFPSSGEGLVLKLREGGGFERVAELGNLN